jgi:hypothetical protein
METSSPQQTEEQSPPRDLRAELFQDLSTQFAAELDSNASLPVAARVALIELLDSDAPTAAEIIAAASINDSIAEGGADE